MTFAGSRTSDLMGVALRLAGFEVRDVVQFLWTYGSGMPKGPDLAKSAEARLLHGKTNSRARRQVEQEGGGEAFMAKGRNNGLMGEPTVSERRRFKAKSQDAQAFEGWSTTLKPAYEPILLARKPLAGTVVENVLEHGTGALNIGACRTPLAGASDSAAFAFNHDGSNRSSQEDGASAGCMEGGWKVKKGPKAVPEGRWPANFCHDGSPESLAMFEAFGERPGALCRSRADGTPMDNAVFGAMRHPTTAMEPRGDAGTAARFFPSLGPDEEDKAFAAEFFYGGKATRTDRDEGLVGRNSHVTVKPTNLMRWLCRLVTPPGGRVLDPFCGSGSTGKAAVLEGMAFVGIEREAAYADIARRRVAWAQQQVAPKKREAA